MESVLNLIKENDNFLIITHTRPDGDSIGSAVALCVGIRQLGKTAYIAKNPETTNRYLPFSEAYFHPEGYVPSKTITVDTATKERISKKYTNLEINAAIDHHIGGGKYAPICYVDSSRGACGEIIYEIVTALGAEMTQELALPLYIAVSTDTGCFRFSNTTYFTHFVASEIMKSGLNISPLNELLFEQKSRERISIETSILSNLRFFYGGMCAVAILTLDDIANANGSEDDYDNLSALTRQITGVNIGILIKEDIGLDGSTECKVSIRSTERFPASHLICGEFGGGGHALAAGALIKGDSKTVLNRLMPVVTSYAEKL